MPLSFFHADGKFFQFFTFLLFVFVIAVCIVCQMQYRMDPEIAMFPSHHFYQSRLTTSHVVLSRPSLQSMFPPRYSNHPIATSPYRFFDVSGQSERGKSTKSYSNEAEVRFVGMTFGFSFCALDRLFGLNTSAPDPFPQRSSGVAKACCITVFLLASSLSVDHGPSVRIVHRDSV